MNKLNKLIRTYIAHAEGAMSNIADMRTELKARRVPMEDNAVKAALVTELAGIYGVATGTSQRCAVTFKDAEKGTKGYKEAHTRYEAARAYERRMRMGILGVTKNHDGAYEVPADMLALAAKLVQMAAQYEQAGKLVDAAIAQAKAKAKAKAK